MNLTDLPKEILLKILKNCDENHKELSTVCKSFYGAFKHIDEDQLWLKLRPDEQLEEESLYKSILNTTRRLRNIQIKFRFTQGVKTEVEEKMLKIIKVQSKWIRRIEITGGSETFMLSVLKFIPNCVSFTNNNGAAVEPSVAVATTSYSVPRKKIKLSYARNLMFNRFKILELSEMCKTRPILKTIKLDTGILNELEIVLESYNYTLIHHFTANQPNLKVLKINTSPGQRNTKVLLPSNFLCNCNSLEYLQWDFYPEFDGNVALALKSVLEQLKSLKELKLSVIEWLQWTPIFTAIATNQINLESMKIDVYGSDISALSKLVQMKKLRKLTLNPTYNEDERDEDEMNVRLLSIFEVVALPKLKKFQLNHPASVSLIRQIPKFAPDLKKLHVQIEYDLHSFQEIFMKFRQVESLTIYEESDVDDEIMRNDEFLLGENSHNENLKKLKLMMEFRCTIDFMRQLYENFPNLEELHMNGFNYNFKDYIRTIKNL